MVKAKKTYKKGGKVKKGIRDSRRPDGSLKGTSSETNNQDQMAIAKSYMDRTSTYGGKYATGDDKVERDRILNAKKRKFNKGGKVVAQGATKKDVRQEKKMERKVVRADKTESKKTQRRYKKLMKKVNRFIKDGQERNTIG